MSEPMVNNLAQELGELFDIRKAKLRDEKRLTHEASEAQKDIRLMTLMFRDGIPDIVVEISDQESIFWNSKVQQLLYRFQGGTHVLEGTSREIRIRIRPYLTEMVKKAKEMI